VAHQSIAFHADLDQYRILVAICGSRDEAQAVSAGLAFHPQFVTCAAEERHIPRAQCIVESFAVHESHHKDVAIVGVLHYGGRESLHFFEIDLAHVLLRAWWMITAGRNRKPAVLDRISGPGTLDVASSLSACLRRHDHRVVMMVVAMGQRSLHNVRYHRGV
jgi:hypothetical protein